MKRQRSVKETKRSSVPHSGMAALSRSSARTSSSSSSFRSFSSSSFPSSFLLRASRLLVVVALASCLPPSASAASAARRSNSRFLKLADRNYTRVYRALDEGMRNTRRLEDAYRSVEQGRALNVFDVARAIVPGKPNFFSYKFLNESASRGPKDRHVSVASQPELIGSEQGRL